MNASIRPSGRLSVRVQTHVQMSADKRRDQDGVPVPMKQMALVFLFLQIKILVWKSLFPEI